MADAPKDPTTTVVPTPATTPEPTPAPPVPPVVASDGGDGEPLGEGGLAALKAERQRAKVAEDELKTLRKTLEEHENAKLTELQLAQKMAADQAKEAEMQAARALRFQIIAETQLPPELQKWLAETGDEATLRTQAGELLATFGAVKRNPAPDPSQGAGKDVAPPNLDAQIAEANAKGDWKTALHLQNQKTTS